VSGVNPQLSAALRGMSGGGGGRRSTFREFN